MVFIKEFNLLLKAQCSCI